MPERREAVIIGAARTPTGKFLGALRGFTAPQLGALVVRESVRRAGVAVEEVDEVIMGCVVQAGLGQNPARQAALHGGIPFGVSAVTINKVCGSGLKSVMMAAQAVQLGDSDVVVAGGMESMSNAPFLLKGAREGLRMGDGKLVDSMIHDGLWCAFENYHMGHTGEVVAERYGVTREEQDEYALNSHRKAAAAIRAGKFKDEILPVEIPQKKGAPLVFDTDEPVREDTSLEALGKLRPAFREKGTVTAGNAPGVNDGASALVVTSEERARALGVEPLARVAAQATSGIQPELVMMAPVEAIRKVLRKAGWSLGEVDLIELNEAFSVQAIAIIRELGLDPERVNVNGGAVALGHAIGQSGSRLLTTMLYEMKPTAASTRW
ncbi:MAG: acetyl-CoA C-acetyltransferase [Acidobacteria bacterium]|nr:acetyl-CoA C-acetyltransferase [Acidobacteriota bacterium]